MRKIFQLSNLLVLGLSLWLSGCGGDEADTTASEPTARDPLACEQQLYQQRQPVITAQLAQQTYPLCFTGFQVLYSGISKTPIWVGEYLTEQRIAEAKQLPREDSFHEESRLPTSVRSTLADYRGSGFDRGHLAPNADMPNPAAQADSFSLANIAPQHPENNRKIWARIEGKTRDLTNRYGSSYVVTGVAFLSAQVQQINGSVLVPSHFFKAVYFPSQQQAVVFFSPNDASERYEIISLEALRERTGVDAFPSLPMQVKNSHMLVNINQ